MKRPDRRHGGLDSFADAIRTESLGRIYPNGVVGLRDVSVTIRHGEVVGLLGRSGSGKTTLFRLLVGTIRPSRGCLTVLGTDLVHVRARGLRRLRRNLAWVGQQHNLVPGLSVAHNVVLGRLGREPLWRVLLSLVYLPERERRTAFGILTELGVADKLYDRADDLSGGQQQRVAIARALINEPTLLLADEPVASVDEQTAMDVLNACLGLNRERGSTLLMSLHQPELALRFCPRIIVLAGGTVVYDGPTDGIDRSALYAHADATEAASTTLDEEETDARHDRRPATASV
jgi:phosphonate transport system ATP-binding protein